MSRWSHWRHAPTALWWLLRVARALRGRRRSVWLQTGLAAPAGLRTQLRDSEFETWVERCNAIQAVAQRLPGFACLVRACALASWLRRHGYAAAVVMAVWRTKAPGRGLGHAYVRLGDHVFDQVGIDYRQLEEIAFCDPETQSEAPGT